MKSKKSTARVVLPQVLPQPLIVSSPGRSGSSNPQKLLFHALFKSPLAFV